MTSGLLKYLDEQLRVFLNGKQQKWSQLKTQKEDFQAKNVLYIVIFDQILMSF